MTPNRLRPLPLLLVALAFAFPASAQTTWTLRHQNNGAPQTGYLWGLVEGANGIVAVGENGRILHSADGRAWTRRDSGTTVWLTAVTYGAGRYLAVGDNGTILTSTDSVAWSRIANSGTTARLNNVAFGQNKFVAVGEAGTIVVSADGIAWRPVESGAGNRWLRGLSYGPNWWIATGQASTVTSSNDGTFWTRQNQNDGDIDLEAVTLANTFTATESNFTGIYNYFLAVGSNGTSQAISSFSITYPNDPASNSGGVGTHPVIKPTTNARLRSVATANNVLIATGESGEIHTAASRYGPWNRVAIATTRNLVGAGFARGSIFLVGENEAIFQSEAIFLSRLGNIATRGVIGVQRELTAGTVIRGTRPKQILVRVVGPGLGDFGVNGFVAATALLIYNNSSRMRIEGVPFSPWSTAPNAAAIVDAAQRAGAFPLRAGSGDSAVLLTLEPGSYSFSARSAGGTAGTALVEAYDLDDLDATSSRAINLSTRGQVGTGENILIAGLVVQGPSASTVLVRGVGPGLARFGVPEILADPIIKVVDSTGATIATNDNWTVPTLTNGRTVTGAEIAAAARVTGAFELTEGRDAALLITLVPGAYTIQVSGVNATTGVALVEAYDVPNN